MSITFALDTAKHDLVIQGGHLVIVSGAEEIRQRILVTLLHDYQEYFLSVDEGVPWYDLLLGSNDVAMVDAILRQAVFSVPGVISIQEFQTSFENRKLSIYIVAEVQTIESQQSETITITTVVGG